MPITELHLAGAYGIPEILAYNASRTPPEWNYPQFFPFWQVCPDLVLRNAATAEPHPGALLLVLNLNAKTWEWLEPRLPAYGKTAQVLLEAYEGWELAYAQAGRFDAFINFDSTRAADHPNFTCVNIPYNPDLGSSHRDRRGLQAWLALWSYSKRRFVDLGLRQFLPRRQKAVMIAALAAPERYQVRLRMARKWPAWVDVYGRGWPKDLPNYRGICISKLDVFQTYRYALVFENQRQPGYVTEKLLDCFAGGIVPLYHGAPDAARNVPEGMFVPFTEENAPLERWITDDALYRRVRQTIHENRAAVFERYSITQFTAGLTRALNSLL
jgi:hypothetical protein